MTWPALEHCVKMFDESKYQNPTWNTSNPTAGRIDWPELATENPEVKVNICRLSGSSSGIDPDGKYNFNNGLLAGFEMAVYINMSPTRSIEWLMDNWWKPTIDSLSEEPKLIIFDCESTHGQSSNVITKHIRDALDAIKKEWPNAEIWIYTAAWWWNPNVNHGWESGERFWVAHYIFVVQDPITGDWRQAVRFTEMDRKLPIHNNFTPRLPTGVSINQVGAWQMSSRGIIKPITRSYNLTPRVDMNYILLSDYNRIWGNGDEPEPQPEPEPTEVEVRVKAGEATVKVVEV